MIRSPEEPIFYKPSDVDGPLRQGEVLSNLIQTRLNSEDVGLMDMITHPLAIIVSQDCDLSWDFRDRVSEQPSENKLVPNVLFCEMLTAAEMRSQRGFNAVIYREIRQNKNERFHFFRNVQAMDDASGEGLPELIEDFKRYFTVPTGEIYSRLGSEAKRRFRLCSPYLEHFTTRFCYYQFRVALPLDHYQDKSR